MYFNRIHYVMLILNMKRTLTLFIFCLTLTSAFSQEYTQAMLHSQVLRNAYQQFQLDKKYQKAGSTDTLSLPFIDDFSSKGVYPNTAKWIDNSVFINNNFAIKPPSIGVATFDGFNAQGRPYVQSEFAYGVCDTLTSKPIDLFFPSSDSVYISFFIQPQGNGRPPAINDSLILEFKNIRTDKFVKIKSWPGSTTKDFKYILIPITDTSYLKKGFQFRFKNKGSQFGADDHWHIDYVKLDRFRSKDDTLLNDVSINSNATSLLKDYTAIPWNQMDVNLLAENHFVNIKNNFNFSSNVDFTFTSYIENAKLDSVTKGLFLGSGVTSKEESKKVNIPLSPTKAFDVITTYSAGNNTDLNKFNDTLIAIQRFKDYYAYDDGTAEDGYGISASANGRFAYGFNTKNSDTLTEVLFHFTQKQVPLVNQIFTLTIWKSIDPEVIIYQKTSLSPTYIDSLNGFAGYQLDSPVIITGEFFVGWIQATNFFMNIGLDRNTINNQHMFYRVNSTGWQQSGILGSVMIRPVFGDKLWTGISNTKKKENAFTIYPNPGNGLISINHEYQVSSIEYRVINIQGQVIIESNYSESIDISKLPRGMYIIQMLDEHKQILGSQKYLKNE